MSTSTSLYSAGAWSARRTAVTVLRILITLAMVSSTFVGVAAGDSVGAPDSSIEQNAAFGLWASIINVLFYVGALWLGNSEYLRAGQRATMDRQVVELERSRAQLAEQAVRLDRLRIARELHDSVAHHVSLMGVQAAVARRTLEVSADSRMVPAAVTTAMERVEVSAREAVEELQSVLVTLRSEDEGTAFEGAAPESLLLPTADAPSTRTLAQIPALVDSVTESGMTGRLPAVRREARSRSSARSNSRSTECCRRHSPTCASTPGAAASADVPAALRRGLDRARHHRRRIRPSRRLPRRPRARWRSCPRRRDVGSSACANVRMRWVARSPSAHGTRGGSGCCCASPREAARGSRIGRCSMDEELESPDPVRVLLVDDHDLVRAGFRALLDLEPGFEVVGEAENGAEAIRAAQALAPDVICMDVQMPVMDGIEATRALLASDAVHARVIVLTTFRDDAVVQAALVRAPAASSSRTRLRQCWSTRSARSITVTRSSIRR